MKTQAPLTTSATTQAPTVRCAEVFASLRERDQEMLLSLMEALVAQRRRDAALRKTTGKETAR